VEYPEKAPVKQVLNFCANNYLGLSGHPEIVRAAHQGLDERGFGLSSVRFICGTQDKHKELEGDIAQFLGMEDAILFSSCFDANLGVSIIDGIRLCKAERRRYKHLDLHDLERHLRESMNRRFRLIVTDGAFSMDGDLAPLEEICNLAEEHEAIVLVDESHATGFIGSTGRGTHEHCDVMGRVDIITTTFGKALGGASGGAVASDKVIVDILRQRARPYLFSNTMSPAVVAATIKALELLKSSTALRDKLEANTEYFRSSMKAAGFDIREGIHPIVPIILHEAELVQEMSRRLYDQGIYVIGFFYPVVPRGKARIRVQISAAHEREHLDLAIAAFTRVGRELGVLK